MTLNSPYEFFRSYFSYKTSGNASYARAISAAMKIARKTIISGDISVIQDYLHNAHSYSLTKDMLHRLVYLAMKHYQDPFNEIQYYKTIVRIDKGLLNTKHRGINIPIECGFDNANGRMIILTFGPFNNMKEEIKVIKGLLKEFPATEPFPDSIKTIAYWDLSKGKAAQIEYQPLLPVDRKSLLDAADRIK